MSVTSSSQRINDVGLQKQRIFGLDLFRALAIISVMYGHQSYLIKGDLNIPGNLIPSGVEWFFVLSGFLIGQIIIRDFSNKGNWKEVLFFLKRRWYRTLPNYYLFLLLNFILAYWGLIGTNSDHFSWKFFFFLQNFDAPFTDFFWESWSLSIEEWFYVIFPFLAFLFLRFTPLNKKKSLAVCIFLLISLPLIYRLLKTPGMALDSFWFDNIIRKLVIYRLDSIIYGVLMAFFKVYFQQYWSAWRYTLLGLGIIYLQFVSFLEVDISGVFEKVFRLPLNSLALALLLPFFDHLRKAPAFLSKPIRWISKISYSLYLVHLGIIIGLINQFSCLCTPENIIISNIVFWLSSLLIATIVYKYFELPFTKLRPSYS